MAVSGVPKVGLIMDVFNCLMQFFWELKAQCPLSVNLECFLEILVSINSLTTSNLSNFLAFQMAVDRYFA